MDKNKITIILMVIISIVISLPSFARSNLKTKLSNFFRKIEKKLDTNNDDKASITTIVRGQIATASVKIASTTKKLTLEDFGLLPQKEVKIDVLFTQKILKNFDEEGKYIGCQGFTTDGEFFYVVLLSGEEEYKKHTKILKIRISDLKIVKQKELGVIGHSNSLTYNPKTKKIYIAPLWKKWNCVFDIDTDLENLNKNTLFYADGSIIKDKDYRSVTYLPTSDCYIVKYPDELSLNYFDSNFKLFKIVKLKEKLSPQTTTQALSTDEINFFSITNSINLKPLYVKENYILIYDMDGNYIDTYIFPTEFGNSFELEQITFTNGKCYGLAQDYKGNFRIYKIQLRNSSFSNK